MWIHQHKIKMIVVAWKRIVLSLGMTVLRIRQDYGGYSYGCFNLTSGAYVVMPMQQRHKKKDHYQKLW